MPDKFAIRIRITDYEWGNYITYSAESHTSGERGYLRNGKSTVRLFDTLAEAKSEAWKRQANEDAYALKRFPFSGDA